MPTLEPRQLGTQLEALLVDVIGSVFGETATVTTEPVPPRAVYVSRLMIHDCADDSYVAVEVRSPLKLATALAAGVLGEENPPEDVVLDLVGEVGNIAAGHVKAALCHDGRLSLPATAVLPAPEEPAGAVRGAVRIHDLVMELVVLPMPDGGIYTRWPAALATTSR